MSNKEKNPSHIQSVAKALQLLELLAQEKRALSLAEIVNEIGWPKSTVHGLLSTLHDYDYVDQSPVNGRYSLGTHLFELGNIVARSWDVRSVALPAMQQLKRQLSETVQLGTEDKGEVLYLEKLDSAHVMQIVSEVGSRLPMHCSGLGKVLLAHKTPAEVKWIINKQGMRRMTSRTITDPVKLERELRKIRAQGYAIDDREIMENLRCIAAPIHDKDGSVKYAVSVSGLSDVMHGDHLEKIRTMLLQTADKISFVLGYRGETGDAF